MKAELLNNFETVLIKDEEVPRFKAGREFDVIPMDMFWLNPKEMGGICVVLGPMEYLRLTYPDGTKTKFYSLFKLSNELKG